MQFRRVAMLLAVLLVGGSAFAQEQRGAIEGTVKDAQGGVAAGATVVAKSDAGLSFETVTDAAARKAILELPGPAAEIELHDGKVAAWACEAHNCGPHQWTVLVDPKSGATDVCYFDEEKLGDKSRWFLSNGKQEDRQGNCQLS